MFNYMLVVFGFGIFKSPYNTFGFCLFSLILIACIAHIILYALNINDEPLREVSEICEMRKRKENYTATSAAPSIVVAASNKFSVIPAIINVN